VDIGGIVEPVPLRLRRHAGEAALLRGGDHPGLAQTLALGDRLLRPGTGVDVGADVPGAGEIERDRGELGAGAALQEQHRVVVGNRQKGPQIGLGALGDADELGAAVAHLHHRHAAAGIVEHLRPGPLQHGFRQCGRSGGEVEHSGHAVLVS
jgi:hypothetical protein